MENGPLCEHRVAQMVDDILLFMLQIAVKVMTVFMGF